MAEYCLPQHSAIDRRPDHRSTMPSRTSKAGSELFIVDNSDEDWKVLRYLHDWCQISKAIDIATGYFEIGSLLGLKDEWQKVDHIRILMGDEVSLRTRTGLRRRAAPASEAASTTASRPRSRRTTSLPASPPSSRRSAPARSPAASTARRSSTPRRTSPTPGWRSSARPALVGSSNFTYPGLTENIELNVQITGRPVSVLQEWYEQHWDAAEDVTAEILRVIERHTREYTPFEVYAKALHELHRREEPSDRDWLDDESRVYSATRPVPEGRLPQPAGDRQRLQAARSSATASASARRSSA